MRERLRRAYRLLSPALQQGERAALQAELVATHSAEAHSEYSLPGWLDLMDHLHRGVQAPASAPIT